VLFEAEYTRKQVAKDYQKGEEPRNQAQDRGWSPLFFSHLSLIKENESILSVFVSKVAITLSGTSSSA